MKKKPEPEVMICSLQTMEGATQGSTVDHCTKCQRAVWVSPSGLLVSLQIPVMCMDCAVLDARERGEPIDMMPPTAQQLVEVASALGVDVDPEVLKAKTLDYMNRRVAKVDILLADLGIEREFLSLVEELHKLNPELERRAFEAVKAMIEVPGDAPDRAAILDAIVASILPKEKT